MKKNDRLSGLFDRLYWSLLRISRRISFYFIRLRWKFMGEKIAYICTARDFHDFLIRKKQERLNGIFFNETIVVLGTAITESVPSDLYRNLIEIDEFLKKCETSDKEEIESRRAREHVFKGLLKTEKHHDGSTYSRLRNEEEMDESVVVNKAK